MYVASGRFLVWFSPDSSCRALCDTGKSPTLSEPGGQRTGNETDVGGTHLRAQVPNAGSQAAPSPKGDAICRVGPGNLPSE